MYLSVYVCKYVCMYTVRHVYMCAEYELMLGHPKYCRVGVSSSGFDWSGLRVSGLDAGFQDLVLSYGLRVCACSYVATNPVTPSQLSDSYGWGS